MSSGNLESLSFEREVSAEIFEEDIVALQSILFDIQTTTVRANYDGLSAETKASIERKLEEEKVRQNIGI
jgi:hypothetical protein